MSFVSSSSGGRAVLHLVGVVALAAAGCQSERSDDRSASPSVLTSAVAASTATASAAAQWVDPTATELTTKEHPTPAQVVPPSSPVIAGSVSNGAVSSSAAASGAVTSPGAAAGAAAPHVGATKPLGSKPTAASSAAGAPPISRPAAALVASAAVSGEGYRTYLQAPSPLVVGSDATVTVHLEPQTPFKSNDKYPYRFTVSGAEGVSAPAAAVTSAQVSPSRTTLHFPVTAKKVGRASIAGTFSFSVCTEEKCLVERAPLVLGFEVVADAVSATPHP